MAARSPDQGRSHAEEESPTDERTRPQAAGLDDRAWIAELTAGVDHDYSRTRKALSSQALATAIFVRSFSQYFPAVKAFIEVLNDAPGETCARVALEFHRELALVPREALTTEDIAELLRSLLRRAPLS